MNWSDFFFGAAIGGAVVMVIDGLIFLWSDKRRDNGNRP
jgi:hypothetical protein